MEVDDAGMKQAEAEDWRAEISEGEGRGLSGGRWVVVGVLEKNTTVNNTAN